MGKIRIDGSKKSQEGQPLQTALVDCWYVRFRAGTSCQYPSNGFGSADYAQLFGRPFTGLFGIISLVQCMWMGGLWLQCSWLAMLSRAHILKIPVWVKAGEPNQAKTQQSGLYPPQSLHRTMKPCFGPWVSCAHRHYPFPKSSIYICTGPLDTKVYQVLAFEVWTGITSRFILLEWCRPQ